MPPRQKPVPTSPEKTGESVAAPTQLANLVVEVPFVNVRPLTEVQRRDIPREKCIPAYQTKAPVESSMTSKQVIDLILNAEVGATVGQLLGSSPALLKEITCQVSRVRVPVKPAVSSNVNVVEEEGHRDWYNHYIEDGEFIRNRPVQDLLYLRLMKKGPQYLQRRSRKLSSHRNQLHRVKDM